MQIIHAIPLLLKTTTINLIVRRFFLILHSAAASVHCAIQIEIRFVSPQNLSKAIHIRGLQLEASDNVSLP